MFHVKPAKSGGLEGVWRGSGRGLDALRTAQAATWTGAGALLLLAACSGGADTSGKTAAAPTAAPAAAATPPAPLTPAAEKVEFTDTAKKDGGERTFAYSWPAAVSAIPDLARNLTADRDAQLADQKKDWAGALKDLAGEDCGGCKNYDFQKAWDVVADLPRFLSLTQKFYQYTGGAHGTPGTAALVWDREAKKGLAPEDFFVSRKAIQDVLGTRWCKLLKVERRKRFDGEEPDDGDIFPCPQVKDLTLLLGSKSKTHFDRIGLIADPYVAGSYAEGTYEFTIPVSQDILGAVKPEYRAYFTRGE